MKIVLIAFFCMTLNSSLLAQLPNKYDREHDLFGQIEQLPISLPPDNWERQYPRISGWNLTAVSVVDSMHAWACGWHDSAAGLVVRTTDGGESWIEQTRTLPLNLNDIHFVNASLGWVVGGSSPLGQPGYIRHTLDGGQSWATQLITPNVVFLSVFFLDSLRGWVCGDSGKILATTNGGTDWETQYQGRPTTGLTDIFLFANGIGWCGGSFVLKTTNFGMQWDSVANIRPWQFSFLNDSVGWAVGSESGWRWKTTNGGSDWEYSFAPYPFFYATDVEALSDSLVLATIWDNRVDPPFDFFPITLMNLANTVFPIETRARPPLWGINFAKTGHGIVVGIDNIVGSRDSGRTWMNQAGNPRQALYDIDMVDDSIGWAVGNKELILHTTDGGVHWEPQTAAAAEAISCIAAIDGQRAFAGGSSFMATTNGGATWLKRSLPEFTIITDISFLDNQVGWATTNQYKVLRTTDGGISWQEQPVPVRTFWAVAFVDTQYGWCVGESGFVYATTNGGSTWILQVDREVLTLTSVSFVDREHGWVAGGNLVLRTTNGGMNWLTSDSSYYPYFQYSGVHFVNRDTGWAVGDRRTIIATTNGGVTWIVQSAAGEFEPPYFAVEAVSSRLAWISGNGEILHTINGGGIAGVQPVSAEIPTKFGLEQNYPNPFNPATKIHFRIPSSGSTTLRVYDVLGREVASLIDGFLPSGYFQADFDASRLASGVYLYRLVWEGKSVTRKMLVLK